MIDNNQKNVVRYTTLDSFFLLLQWQQSFLFAQTMKGNHINFLKRFDRQRPSERRCRQRVEINCYDNSVNTVIIMISLLRNTKFDK